MMKLKINFYNFFENKEHIYGQNGLKIIYIRFIFHFYKTHILINFFVSCLCMYKHKNLNKFATKMEFEKLLTYLKETKEIESEI